MKRWTSIARAGLLACLLMSGQAWAQEYNAPEAEGAGEIQALDFGAFDTVINGTVYAVNPNVRVEIGGSYGAFTMLEEGMLVEFTFLQFSDGRREINYMREVNEVEEY